MNTITLPKYGIVQPENAQLASLILAAWACSLPLSLEEALQGVREGLDRASSDGGPLFSPEDVDVLCDLLART